MGTPLSAHQRGELTKKLSARLWRAFSFQPSCRLKVLPSCRKNGFPPHLNFLTNHLLTFPEGLPYLSLLTMIRTFLSCSSPLLPIGGRVSP